MKPEEFIDTARDLLQSARREGDFGSCISRAYYAIYLIISAEILRSIPLLTLQSTSLCQSKNHIAHERLSTLLQASKNVDLKHIGEKLENLRSARIEADYRLDKLIAKPKAVAVLEYALVPKHDIDRLGIQNLVKIVKAELERI